MKPQRDSPMPKTSTELVPTVPRNTKASAMPTVMPTMTCVRRPPKKRSDAHPANRTPTNPTQSNMVESVPAIAGECEELLDGER